MMNMLAINNFSSNSSPDHQNSATSEATTAYTSAQATRATSTC